MRASVEDTTDNLTAKAKEATQQVTGSVKSQAESAMGRGSVPKPGDAPTPVKALEPSAIDAATVKKRGPGRPKGSTNKSKADSATAQSASTKAPARRGPGRPKGSKNKPKTTTTASDPTSSTAPAKRGPGRPKGSKNKPKAASAKTSTTGKKRGPKKGTPIPRDEFGNLLKKDGTPRKRPGPKPKS